ncbi:MAG: ABC transporter substrate-binding protein [Actinobacteria bacterium]|nr:ABC transporter substrate-binding protein [Actinomycetota bacterium]
MGKIINLKKISIVVVILSLIVTFSMVGCKTTTAVETTVAETTAVETTVAETTTTETMAATTTAAEVTFDKPVTITVMGWHPSKEAQDEINAAFMKKYPNITLNFEIQLPDEYFVNIKSAYSAGAPPDVAQFQPGAQIGPFLQYLEPLAPIAEQKWGTDWKSKFYSFCNDQVEWTGKEYYMLPQGWTPTGVWANTTLLKKYGLDIPKNLDDLLKIRDKVQPDGLATFLCGFKDNWNAMDLFFFMLDDFAPGEFYKAEQGQSSFESKGFLDAVKMWKYFFDEKLVQPGAYSLNTYMESVTQYMQGKGILVPLGSWHLPLVYLSPVENSQHGGFAPFLFPDLNGDGKNPLPTVTMGSGFGITKGLKESDPYKFEACWTFLEYLLTGEGMQMYADAIWQYPASTEIKISDATFEKAGDLAAEFKANNQWYFDNTEVQGAREPRYTEIKQGIYDMLSAVATGQKTPEKALADLQKVSESIKR